jgi:hypothetical protein
MSVPGNAFTAYAEAQKTKSGEATTFLYLVGPGEESPAFSIVEFAVSCAATTGTLTVDLYTTNNKKPEEAESTAITSRPVRTIVGITASKTKARTKYKKEPGEEVTVLKSWILPLPMAPFLLQAPLGREIGLVTAVKEKLGVAIGLRAKPSTGEMEISGYVEFEE